MIERALEFAGDAHVSQYLAHVDVEYLAHVSRVAELVGLTTSDEEVIAAALLHDTMKDSSVGLSNGELAVAFGQRVADLATGLRLIDVAGWVEPAVLDIWLAEFIDEFPRTMLYSTDDEKLAFMSSRMSTLREIISGGEASPTLVIIAQQLLDKWTK